MSGCFYQVFHVMFLLFQLTLAYCTCWEQIVYVLIKEKKMAQHGQILNFLPPYTHYPDTFIPNVVLTRLFDYPSKGRQTRTYNNFIHTLRKSIYTTFRIQRKKRLLIYYILRGRGFSLGCERTSVCTVALYGLYARRRFFSNRSTVSGKIPVISGLQARKKFTICILRVV